jgi:hypothetical protein
VTAVRNTPPSFITRPVYRVLSHWAAIPEIEEKARSWKSVARTKSSYNYHKSPFWTEEEKIELFTRKMIRGNFVDLLGKYLSAADLQALETVLFTISYPIIDFHYQP